MGTSLQLRPQQQIQPLLPPEGVEEQDATDVDELRSSALAARYGDDFPLREQAEGEEDQVDDASWISWARGRWEAHGPGVRRRLMMVERNRLFRAGIQWISSADGRVWRPPPKSRDEARIVHNVIAPALDQRLQIVSENRPGFKTRPRRREPDLVRKAEAQQIALEYQFDQQKMGEVRRVAGYWCLTDGVSFVEVYWDPERGDWAEAGPAQVPLGDLAPRVLRIEHVRVSANATATEKPDYWVIKRPVPLQTAVAQYGGAVVQSNREARGSSDSVISMAAYRRLGYELPGEDELHEEMETVDEIVIYAEKSEFLPEGLTLKIVGDAVVFMGPLLFGCAPMVRWTDGSSDPAFFPKAIMEDWVDDQVRLNAILSRWVESVRRSGGTLLAKANALTKESMVLGGMTVVEVRGGLQANDAVYPIPAVSLSADAKELWALTLKSFEDKSGWNDTSRGTFSAEQSGRSILAQRETLERTFAPPVNAAAQSMSAWATISLHGMRFGYEEPRMVSIPGNSRPDLGRALEQDDFDGVADVWVDPETLMPMPTTLKLFTLDQLHAKGILSPNEYRQRLPFAFVQDIQTPDMDHFARAKRCAEAILQGQPDLPIHWQDDEAIHQDILQRDIILRDDLDPMIVERAKQRWIVYANQASMKQTMMAPAPMPNEEQGKGGGGNKKTPSGLPPSKQPFQGSAPSVASAPSVRAFANQSDQQLAGAQFDAIQPS